MSIYENKLYLEDVANVAGLRLPWEQLEGCSMVISGATGMIGSFLIDVLISGGVNIA